MTNLTSLILFTGLLFPSLLQAQTNSFTDPRDGHVYKTVQIGDQVWMAENIKWAPSITKLYEQRIDTVSHIYCYDDDLANCEKYGMIYAWPMAQKACPVGWHLPSRGEYEQLINSIAEGNKRMAYKSLLKGGSSGFEGLLAGYIICTPYAHYISLDRAGPLWTSEDLDKSHTISFILSRVGRKVRFFEYNKYRDAGYVRCIEN